MTMPPIPGMLQGSTAVVEHKNVSTPTPPCQGCEYSASCAHGLTTATAGFRGETRGDGSQVMTHTPRRGKRLPAGFGYRGGPTQGFDPHPRARAWLEDGPLKPRLSLVRVSPRQESTSILSCPSLPWFLAPRFHHNIETPTCRRRALWRLRPHGRRISRYPRRHPPCGDNARLTRGRENREVTRAWRNSGRRRIHLHPRAEGGGAPAAWESLPPRAVLVNDPSIAPQRSFRGVRASSRGDGTRAAARLLVRWRHEGYGT